MKFKILFILFLLPVLAFNQANRVKQIQDNTGVYRGSVPPTDTSLTWRNTTDSQSYFWDSQSSAWNVVQFNYEVDSVGQIALQSFPTGAIIQSKGYYEYGDGGDAVYYVYDSKTGYENEDTLGAVFETGNAKFAIMDTRKPLNVFALGVDRAATVSGANDTEAMQRIFDYCAKTNWEEVIEINQRCSIDLDSTIRYDGTQNTKGLRIKGIGRSNGGLTASTFFFRGSPNDTMFVFTQISNLHIEGIDFNGGNLASIGVRFDPLSFSIYFKDCHFGAMANTGSDPTIGIDTDITSGLQVSELHVNDSRIVGLNYGVRLGDGNNKDFYLGNNIFQNSDTAIWIQQTDAAHIYGNTFSGNNVSISCFNGCNGLVIEANEVEGDSMFFYGGEQSAITKNANLIGNFVSLTPGKKIAVYGDGRLQLIGNDLKQNDGKAVQIKWATGDHDAIYSVGNKILNSSWNELNTDTFPFINLSDNVYDGALISRNDMGGGLGSLVERFPDYVKTIGVNSIIRHGEDVVFTPENASTDRVIFDSDTQMNRNIYTGVSGASFTLIHNGENTIWFNDRVLFQGKNLETEFGIGIRSGAAKVKGIDNSTAAGSSGFGIYNNSIEFLTATSTGDVGVGIAPTEKLQVNGNCVIDGTIYLNAAKTVGIFTGTGDPEGAVTASVGSTFHRTDGGASTTFYVKESGTGNTGWVAK